MGWAWQYACDDHRRERAEGAIQYLFDTDQPTFGGFMLAFVLGVLFYGAAEGMSWVIGKGLTYVGTKLHGLAVRGMNAAVQQASRAFGRGRKLPPITGGSGEPEYIELYHATRKPGDADSIRRGISLSESRAQTDFGRGFYVTNNRAQAVDWAGDNGEVLTFRVPVTELVQLKSRRFAGGTASWGRFVRHHRLGGRLHGYDTAEGPMLLNPKSFLKGKPPKVGGHQMSFHTERATELLHRYLVR